MIAGRGQVQAGHEHGLSTGRVRVGTEPGYGPAAFELYGPCRPE